jgi:CRP-like cAMP-binding protein
MKHLRMDPKELRAKLHAATMFQSLSAEEVEGLSACCDAYEYSDGECLVEQDSTSPYLYVILEGRVDIVVRGKEEMVKISQVRSGDIVGEASMFLDHPRTASVRADGYVISASISRVRLFDYINANPRAGLKILSTVIFSLLRKLSTVNKELALEKESSVTLSDIEEIKRFFPKNLADILSEGATA